MSRKSLLLIFLLTLPSVIFAKDFLGISSPFSSTMSYKDPAGSTAGLSSNFDISHRNRGFEYMRGDLERGDELRVGAEIRNISLDGTKDTTEYFIESREYLLKASWVGAEAERAWNFGLVIGVFIGFGALEYKFKKIDENRTSEKTKEVNFSNYTPYGIDGSLEIYITNSFFVSGRYRMYLNEEIKIKYLPNPDGSESIGSFRNHSSLQLVTGFFF